MASDEVGSAIVHRLLASDDPTVVFKAHRNILGDSEQSLVKLRRSIAPTDRARRLLAHRRPDGTIATNPYTKWQGPHWTLVQLALIEYPPGDPDLVPLRDQAYEWMLSPAQHEVPPYRLLRGSAGSGPALRVDGRQRHLFSLVLELENDRTRLLVERLIELQWPDGGWNCDKRPEARTSSFMETLIPLRGLHAYGRTHSYQPAIESAARAAEFLLDRRLFWRKRDGRLLEQFIPISFPIRFYDPLIVLQVMAEIGKIDDPRCGDALDLLEAKQLQDGGFPAEIKNARTVETRTTRGSWADWGPGGKTRTNELVTVDALAVLQAAGRL